MTPQEAIELVKQCGLNIEGNKYAECEKVVLTALEKQILKKPLEIEGDYTALYGICPNCKNMVCDNEDYKHCNECGQALDWSDSNG